MFLGAVAGAVSGTVISSIPSTLDTGLLDVTIANEARKPRPTGTRGILDLWSTGQPSTIAYARDGALRLRSDWAGRTRRWPAIISSSDTTGIASVSLEKFLSV